MSPQLQVIAAMLTVPRSVTFEDLFDFSPEPPLDRDSLDHGGEGGQCLDRAGSWGEAEQERSRLVGRAGETGPDLLVRQLWEELPGQAEEEGGTGQGGEPGSRGRTARKAGRADAKQKLERSRQSARECRARKKLRYQAVTQSQSDHR